MAFLQFLGHLDAPVLQMPLADVAVRAAKPREKAYKLADGHGMYLEVMPSGAKYWRLKYRIDGKEKRAALGVYPKVSLLESTIDRRDRVIRYIAVRLENGTVRRLVEGKVALYDVLNQDTVWAIDLSFEGTCTSSVRLGKGLASVPVGYKPTPGVRLRPDHHYAS